MKKKWPKLEMTALEAGARRWARTFTDSKAPLFHLCCALLSDFGGPLNRVEHVTGFWRMLQEEELI